MYVRYTVFKVDFTSIHILQKQIKYISTIDYVILFLYTHFHQAGCVQEIFVYLVKQWAVCNRKSKGVKTHPQYHIIRSIVTVAFTAACQESEYSLPAEHHSITQGQRVRVNNLVPDSYTSIQIILKPYPKNNLQKCLSVQV